MNERPQSAGMAARPAVWLADGRAVISALVERRVGDAAAEGDGVGCHSGSGGGDVGVDQADGGVLIAGLRGGVEADVGEVCVDEVGGADSADTGVSAGDGADGFGAVDDDVGVDGSACGFRCTVAGGVEDDEVFYWSCRRFCRGLC